MKTRAERRAAARAEEKEGVAGAIPATPEETAKKKKVGKLSESDLKLIQAADEQLTLAQSNVHFAQQHISRTYGLSERSIVEKDGTIYEVVLPGE